MTLRRTLLILAIFLLGMGTSRLATSFPSSPKPPSTKPVEITKEATTSSVAIAGNQEEFSTVGRVVDGDTVELADGRRVRYIGIDTPEVVDPRKPVACFGKEASEENRRLMEGKAVRLQKDVSETDRYGRLLRYVWVGDVFINDHLVRQGFARVASFPPDVSYIDQFRQAEEEARNSNRGLWAGCGESNTSSTSKRAILSISGVPASPCIIKGNISSSGEKIYHLLECGSYDKTAIDESVGERWFCTEEDAVKAGWRKAKNC